MAGMTYDEINARVEKLENEFEDSLSELPGVDYALAVRIIDPLTEDEHGSSMISDDDDAAAQLIEALFDTVRDEAMPLDEYVDFAIEVLMNIGYSEPGFLEQLRDKLPDAIEAVNEEREAEEDTEEE